MRILVTGATGFVGGWLGVELARAHPEAEIFGTHHGPPGPPLPPGFPASARILPCDLTEPGAARELVDQTRPERVFHLAGFASAAGGDADLVHRVNVGATVELLGALETADRPCRVLLASSGYVYGPTTPGRPAHEDDPLAPRGVYAGSKAAMEEAARRFAGRGGLALVVTRAFNHTGPRQSTEFVAPAFARQIARCERGLDPPVVRVGNLVARRDFLDVRDVTRAYRLLLDREAGAFVWQIVNVASGAPVTIQALLETLLQRAHQPLSIETDPARMRPVDLPESAGDPARLRALTGWQPEIALSRMLGDTLDWWRGHTDL